MPRTPDKVSAVVLACLALAGCAEGPFDQQVAVQRIQAKPIQLDGEQVMLTPEQVACGEHDNLWVIIPQDDRRSRGRLTDSARELGFSDDLEIGDPGFPRPYAQIRGHFTVQANNARMQDMDEETKVVEVKVGVVMDHACLRNPLPQLMGLHRGQFSPEDSPAFRFLRRGRDNWVLDQLIH